LAISRRPRRSRFTLALLILTSIAVLTLDFRDAPVIDGARDAASGAMAPLRGAAETVTRPIGNAWSGLTGYGDLEAENAELRERIAEMEGEAALNEDAAEQLAGLLDQLSIDWVQGIERETARVVSGPISNFTDTIDISKGTDAGIQEGMPVVTGAGLVGRVVQATGSRATIQLLTDPDFNVGVRAVPGGAQGTARGTGSSDTLLVDSNLESTEEVRRHTLLTTSGADRSRYPASIPVGRVVETRESTRGLSLELVVRPMVDVDQLTFVTVLLWEPPQ
jgi:rod shape-determining protein MreC